MAYVQLAKALYDYEAQAEDELSLKEDDTLYILEADDPEWFKAKLRRLNPDGTPVDDDAGGADDIGLVPANYVEEAEPLRLSRALYDYAAQNEDELTVSEDELLRVYETDGLWLLVKKQGDDALGEGGVGRLGYVPANYVDEVAAVDVGDATEMDGSPTEDTAPVVVPGAIPTLSSSSASAPAVDKSDGIKMWAVSVMDAKKKKKKKGTLGIGNGALFFASESDKTPVQKIPVLAVLSHSLENKGKQVHIDLDSSAGVEGDVMEFVCDKKDSDEIAAKLDESKTKAQRMADMHEEAAAQPEEHPRAPVPPPLPPVAASSVAPATAPSPPPAAPPAPTFQPPPSRTTAILPPPVRKSATSPAPRAPTPPPAAADGEPAMALYDFEAQGDDELTVAENESLTLIERENDDWWKVRNASGQEGVVPASYVEVVSGSAAANGKTSSADEQAVGVDAEAEAEQQRQDEEAAAAAEQEQLLAAEQRRKEARDRLAREAEERRRREALKAQPAPAPPKAAPSTAATDKARAAQSVKYPEGRSAPARPKEAGNKSKPAPGRTRIWHDRTKQFRVEAEFVGFNQGKLRLHKINGVVIEVAIEKMSKPDIQYLEEVTGKNLMPRRSGPSSSTAAAVPSDPRQVDRQRERQKEKEREMRRRSEAARGPRRNIDWFEFFLAAGVDVHDCTRYASAFERDNIDDTVLADMEPSVLRSLGLREGDNIRVMKYIEKKYKGRRSTPSTSSANTTSAADIDKQMKADEDLARKLQDQERSARRDADGATSSPGLFSGPDGSLKNNTRRGRPTPSSRTTESAVDATSIVKAGESLARVSSPSTRSSTTSPTIERNDSKVATSGFDDDAWTPRPSSTKPSTPAPPAKPATPQPAAPTPPPAPPAPATSSTPAVAAPAAEAAKPAPDPNSALFEKLAAMKPPSADQSQARMGASPSNGSFLGNAGVFNPNGPRGPMAPVPQNQGLLQPLVPTQGTGQFVPTRGMGAQTTGWGGMQGQPTGFGSHAGMQGQPTGFGGQAGMQSQPTGFYSGPSYQQPQQTGYGMGGMMSQPTGWMGSQQTAMSTNISGFASPQPPAQQLAPQQTASPQAQNGASAPQQSANGGAADKYGAGSIFASMKSGTFAKGDEAPQASQKYDALRPQPTGWSPAGVQQPQQTGWGGGVGQQMTGMPGGMGMMNTGMGMMQPQFTAQPGMYQQAQYGGQQQQQGYGQQGYGYQPY
ncbi:unnamed protein product [Parajaminaea phylloscopi]